MLVHARRVLLCLFACAAPAHAATFTVTNASDAGTNSLRWAIGQANSVAGADTIAFNIAGAGVHTINLASALPDVTTTVTIDGTTQPGYAGTPLIELNGAGAGAGVSGLTLTQANNLVKGLAINRFAAHGVLINGGTGHHTVTACHLGLNAAGTAALANGHSGVWIASSPNNTIGPGNVISGNTVDGVRLDQAAAASNTIKGNRIGTNLAGTAAVPNGFNGIVLTNGVPGTLIGGTTAADLNVISGNTKNGVAMSTGTTGTLIERNYIGLAADGAAALGNLLDGVLVIDAPNTSVGGTVAGTFNIIAANGAHGVELRGDTSNAIVQRNIIGADLFGTLDRGNARYGVLLDGADGVRIGAGPWGAGGNLISGNGDTGIELTNGAAGAVIVGNRIGTDYNGTLALANSGDGVRVDSGYVTTVGSSAAPNLVSGNAGTGIDVVSDNSAVIVGNRLGTDANGSAALPNAARGIWIRDTWAGATIGGTDHDPWTCNRACNLVSGNGGYGIQLGSTQADAYYVYGNFIGTNLAGTAALPNHGAGIDLGSGWGTLLGGPDAGQGNLISGNVGVGVEAATTRALTIYGNRIGTNAAGTAAVGNTSSGIYIHGLKPHVDIGTDVHTAGVCDGACNLISGNGGDAIRYNITEEFVSSTKVIRGNFLGTALDGSTCLGNGRDGIRLDSGFDFGRIGGMGALDGNRIACNGGTGIAVVAGNQNYGIGLVGNTFFGNTLLAIDNNNDGVTLNDPGDGDIWLENFPVLDTATTVGAMTMVSGRVDGEASQNYRVEFYASPSCDGSGYGEGRTFLGAAALTTDAGGQAPFSQAMGSTVPLGQVVTATATIIKGSAPFIDYSTSEFSACVTARPPAPTAANGGAICDRQTVTLSASTVAGATYAWTGPNGYSANVQNPSLANAGTAASGTYSVVATVGGVASAPATTNAVVNACSIAIANPAAVAEGNSGTTPQTFTVSLNHASTQALTVAWTTTDGTATAPADYAAGAGTLTIPANTTGASITRTVAGDTLDEGNETYTVTLSNPSAGTLAQATATATITDDDAAPSVSIADRSCTEGASGSTACAFTVSLSTASGRVVSGTYATASGGATPATAGSDYTAVAATAWSIAAGQTSTTVSVSVLGDTIDEANETFLVNLAGLTNAAAGGNDVQAAATITDDDTANGQLRMSECSVEVTEGAAHVRLTVERTGGSGGGVGVTWATANGTAAAGSDYTAGSGTVAWTSGALGTRSVTVTLVNGAAAENREYFDVALSAPTGGATLGTPATTRVWILDAQDQILVDGFESVLPCN